MSCELILQAPSNLAKNLRVGDDGAEVSVESSDDERDDVTLTRAQMANGHLQNTPAALVMAPKPVPRARKVENSKHEEDSSLEYNSVERNDTPLHNVRNTVFRTYTCTCTVLYRILSFYATPD